MDLPRYSVSNNEDEAEKNRLDVGGLFSNPLLAALNRPTCPVRTRTLNLILSRRRSRVF